MYRAFLSSFFVLIFVSKVFGARKFMAFDESKFGLVDWNDNQVKYLIDGKYIELNINKFNLSDYNWLVEPAEISKDGKLLIRSWLGTLFYYDISTKTKEAYRVKAIYVNNYITLRASGKGTWRIFKDGNIVIESFEQNEKPTPNFKTIIIASETRPTYYARSPFKFGQYLFICYQEPPQKITYPLILRLLDDGSDQFESSNSGSDFYTLGQVKAKFLAFLEITSIETQVKDLNFLPDSSFGGPMLVLSGSEEIYFFSFHHLNQAFDSLKMSSKSCFDLEALIQKKLRLPCSEKSLPLVVYSDRYTQKFSLQVPLQVYSIVYLGAELNRYALFILHIASSKFAWMKLIGNHSEISPPKESKLGRTAYDYKVGIAVDAILGPTRSKASKVKLFECHEFPSCSSCETLGFYLDCRWSQGKCSRDPVELPVKNSCFKILKTYFSLENSQVTVKVVADHVITGGYDIVHVEINGADKRIAEIIDNRSYVSKFPKVSIQNVTLYIQRSTGGPIMAFAKVNYDPSSSFLGILFFLLACICLALNFGYWFGFKRLCEYISKIFITKPITEEDLSKSKTPKSAEAIMLPRTFSKSTNISKPETILFATKLTSPKLTSKLTKSSITTKLTKSEVATKLSLPKLTSNLTKSSITTKLTKSKLPTKLSLPKLTSKLSKSSITTKLSNSEVVTKLTSPKLTSKLTKSSITTKLTKSKLPTKLAMSKKSTKSTKLELASNSSEEAMSKPASKKS